MNRYDKTIATEFRPETRFELNVVPAAPFRALQESGFERLKARLLAEQLEQAWEPGASSLLRRAANEAAAWARLTAYPLLVFPVLFEEKAEEALRVAERKERASQQQRAIVSV